MVKEPVRRADLKPVFSSSFSSVLKCGTWVYCIKEDESLDKYIVLGVCTGITEDEEIDGLYYYYVRSNDENENINYDARIGTFWRLIESNSEKII